MKLLKKGKGIYWASFSTIKNNKKTIHLLAGGEKSIYTLYAERFTEYFNKIKSNPKNSMELIINDEDQNEIRIFNNYEYSDYPEEMAKTVTYTLEVRSKLRSKILQNHTYKNPKYQDNPECEFCYKKVTEVFEDHLLNQEKTKRMVCKKCKKRLSIMRKIMRNKIE